MLSSVLRRKRDMGVGAELAVLLKVQLVPDVARPRIQQDRGVYRQNVVHVADCHLAVIHRPRDALRAQLAGYFAGIIGDSPYRAACFIGIDQTLKRNHRLDRTQRQAQRRMLLIHVIFKNTDALLAYVLPPVPGENRVTRAAQHRIQQIAELPLAHQRRSPQRSLRQRPIVHHLKRAPLPALIPDQLRRQAVAFAPVLGLSVGLELFHRLGADEAGQSVNVLVGVVAGGRKQLLLRQRRLLR